MRQFLVITALSALLCAPATGAQPDLAWRDAAALPELAGLAELPVSAPQSLLGQALAGHWRGTLTYRDFRSDQRVVLPTGVDIGGASHALRLDFVYDDGPGKTVRSSQHWSLDLDGAALRTGEADAPLKISNYHAGPEQDLTLIAFGAGVENDAPIEVRSVVLRRGEHLSISRATRLPGHPWLLRHVLRLTPAP